MEEVRLVQWKGQLSYASGDSLKSEGEYEVNFVEREWAGPTESKRVTQPTEQDLVAQSGASSRVSKALSRPYLHLGAYQIWIRVVTGNINSC